MDSMHGQYAFIMTLDEDIDLRYMKYLDLGLAPSVDVLHVSSVNICHPGSL